MQRWLLLGSVAVALGSAGLTGCGPAPAADDPTTQTAAPDESARTASPFPGVDLEPGETILARARRLAAADTLCRRPGIEPQGMLGDSAALADALVFKTGSPSGSYHAVGCAIARVVERDTRRRVILVNGGGSGENLQALIDGKVDLIISQGDIAHHAYTGEPPFVGDGGPLRRLVTRRPGRTIRAVMGLHYEQVLVIGRRGLSSITDITDESRVVVGGANSGTIGNALEVLATAGVSPDTLIRSSRSALPDLADTSSDPVDVVFLTGAKDQALEEAVAALGAGFLSISEDLRGHLAQEHRYYRDDPENSTVRIRALLLVRRSMPDDLVDAVLEAIHGDIGSNVSLIQDSTVHAARSGIVDDSTLTQDVSVPVHRAAAEVFCTEEGTACAYTRTFQGMATAATGLVIVGSLLFGIAFVGPVRRFVLRFFPRIALSDAFGSNGLVSRWRWLLIPVFAVVVVLSGTLLVSLVEIVYSLRTGLSSAFTNRSFVDNVVWMLVFAASGYENQTFPASILAQITSAATVVVAVGGVLFLVGIVTSDGFARKMKMDLRSDVRQLRSHIIVCGWNRRAPALVRLLCGTQVENRLLKIAIVAELDFDPIERFDLAERQTVYVRGSPMKLANLEAAELARADTVVILSSDESSLEDRDARTLAIAAQVEKFARRPLAADEKPGRPIHTVAELADPENRDLFGAAAIDQILCQRELDEQLLAQSVLNPGLTHFMEEILTVDERNEIYEVPVRTEEKYIGRTFDEALATGRHDGFLLLAISRQDRRVSPNGARAGALLTNPTRADEREYRIRAGDSLLFLAPDQSSLEGVFGDASEWRSALLG